MIDNSEVTFTIMSNPHVRFKDIEVGAYFIYNRCLYIKIHEELDRVNSVCLACNLNDRNENIIQTRRCVWIQDNDKCIIPDAVHIDLRLYGVSDKEWRMV